MIESEARFASPYDRLCELLRAIIGGDPGLMDAIRFRCRGLSDGEAVETAAVTVATAHRRYRAERAFLAASGLKICRTCGRARPIGSFARDGRGGTRPECNECRNGKRKARGGHL